MRGNWLARKIRVPVLSCDQEGCVVLDPDRAGQGIVTVIVEALDALCADLGGRGIVVGPIQPVGPAGRKSLITDPAGNTVALAEPAAR